MRTALVKRLMGCVCKTVESMLVRDDTCSPPCPHISIPAPSLLYDGCRVSLPGVKGPERGVDHPPPSSAEVKERVELYLYSLSVLSWQAIHRLNFTDSLHGALQYQGSSVGIVTELRSGRSGIESRWERDFPPVQTGPGAHPASCTMGTGSFPGVKCGRGVLLTTHPLLAPRS